MRLVTIVQRYLINVNLFVPQRCIFDCSLSRFGRVCMTLLNSWLQSLSVLIVGENALTLVFSLISWTQITDSCLSLIKLGSISINDSGATSSWNENNISLPQTWPCCLLLINYNSVIQLRNNSLVHLFQTVSFLHASLVNLLSSQFNNCSLLCLRMVSWLSRLAIKPSLSL